ncbi:protein of unknown function DUF309 [Caldalkalibacillus thermarum TA2.A1]|uniref:DUF309 domain-containing protein n=1 Tax=Caldalkalibacillus thermarum (strain TA2.A1) TaxID=986075 RepID=F5LAC1_CALTT|nr:DUF309 domain-containing protein [Caldalkalibacillus thermarum]EGL81670.1 protein of unknown function DUF309 [Caldalkalibacillus thermarum TA2.A1]QZT33265.1 DUF309 domain-containing protein [Caldalkalibacillus thermarum TA2.A1]
MYPKAYVDYLVHFHGSRDYFECHEVLEEYWKSQPHREKVWVGLIQLAVGLYHHRRGNFNGAAKMLASARQILGKEKAAVQKLGLDPSTLLKQISERLNDVQQRKAYTSLNLPITDHQLLQHCRQICQEKNLTWGKGSDPDNALLIHKHKLRDRSDVIREREWQKKHKAKQRKT